MLLASATIASAAPATEAEATRNAVSGDISIMANQCGFRTSAYPNSYWVLSLAPELCGDCPPLATAYEFNNAGWDYYCTYNPSNNKVDLHRR